MYWSYVGLHQTISPLHTLHLLSKGCKSQQVQAESQPQGNGINREAHTEPMKASRGASGSADHCDCRCHKD